MHPNLKFAHAWLLKGPLGIPDLCDIVTEYAKYFLPDFHHGSKFLILGSDRQGCTTILKDLLFQRKHRYKHGEAVTPIKNHQLCFSNVYSSVDTLSKFLQRGDKSVWVGYELPVDSTKSDPICKLAMNSRRYGVDFFFTAQSLLQAFGSFVLRNMEVVFVYEYSTRSHRRKLFEHFFNRAYRTFESFEEALRIATEHGGCLCLDQYNYQAYHYMADPTISDFLI
jgi:hypothetical protein